MLAVVPAAHLGEAWATVEPWLRAVEARCKGKESVAALKAAIEAEDVQLWVWHRDGLRALAITELVQYPGTRVCRIRICTGKDRQEWMAPAMAAIEQWAASMGCDAVEPVARRGWQRDLKALGYRCHHIIAVKELRHV